MAEKKKKPQAAEETEETVESEIPAEVESVEESVAQEPDPLALAQAEAEEMKRRWYSVTAEYDNYRKRTASDRTKAYADGRSDVVSKLFPIADNLERALASCKDEQTKKGIEMVTKSFFKLLEEERIAVIDPLGEPFDAEKCEAIMAVEPEEGEESGKVKQVYQKGYEKDGKVLRYAQVVVIK